MKYKKMGLIGTLKVVSCLGDINNATGASPSQVGFTVSFAADVFSNCK